MEPDLEQLQRQVQELEKQNRLLQKQLARSESNRVKLENSYEIQSKLVSHTIQGLEQSQAEAEARSQELQATLENLKLMQSKLVESEKMSALGVVVAGVAHEINNPISFITGNIGYARDYVENLIEVLNLYQLIYPDPDPKITALMEDLEIPFVIQDVFQLLNSMQLGSDRISKIVLGLRTFSRLDEAEYKAADVHDGLDSTLMILQHRLRANGKYPAINVSKDYGLLPKIQCFAGQINQVFMNIFTNAIDAIQERYSLPIPTDNEPDPGRINVSTSIVNSRWVKIVIADNGLGMTEAVRQKIFNPFYTTKPVGKGTGIGMSISYQIIVEKHGGQLDCVSKIGEGTEFIIQIPLN
ncbi:sensor histidine kinase [Leptothoe sp. PORK10 BA2]|uniref:sensor histidine kinase n=1 Tax=Leptothoe sp. PORK10 BA2 TaxID=3110254 RepID=UPI002B1F62CB|nr:ATP-binding protein [Leptothoe sp. PORK10 BA2]MEA5463393.1 ATP-binding protein [Leptothoe sp. PORK10 BA2]